MASKAKTKKYRIQRRLDVWIDLEVSAESFDDAVAKAKELKPDDFISWHGDLLDYNWLPGLSVGESW